MSKLYVNEVHSKTGSTKALEIDSSGKVSTEEYIQQKGLPHVVVAMGGTGGYVALTAGQVIPFNTIVNGSNTSGWNTSTYKYTAPVAGVYSCYALMLPDANMSGVIYFDINDVEFSRQYIADSRQCRTFNNVYLDAGDTCRFRIGTADNYYDANSVATGGLHSLASITFLG